MKQYLLSVIEPDGPAPEAAELEKIMRDVAAVDADMRAAGVWVFAGGLHPPSTATLLRVTDGELLMTDGPYTEGKEHLGGFTIIRATDLDTAIEWGGRLARATTLPVEVRPFHDGPA
ncbi:YciI family protein [Micromonospora cathayae]|uniref:YciI family protein n=1 Tax=Micromonospora cathayae TaxID=3028804 RepID=A0ABY7ZRV6_9ACTN|nr:YciI family protein [Micromonospora sp. HUAS 3]WDZ85635.1 YciI family protein [Micromonospora sp. HUAS 3]